MIYVNKISSKIRVGCSGLIYRKTLRLMKSSIENGQNGQIINLMSSDLSKFEYAVAYFHEIGKGPLHILLTVVLAYHEIGVAGIFGVATIVSVVPLQCK